MEKKEEKTHEVRWSLKNHKLYFDQKQVKGELCIPSVLPKSYKGKWVCPPVTLDLHADSDNTTHALTIMRDSCSINILKAKLVIKDKSGVLAWVEPFTGNLKDYLVSRKLGISEFEDPNAIFTLPTPNLCLVIRQVVKGFQDLRKSGNNHGGFSLEKTYYVMAESGIIIKLCNFEKKEGTFHKKLSDDWSALKDGLVEIRGIANKLKRQFRNIDCCQLDGLIGVLGDIAPGNAESAFEVIQRQPFFWGKVERRVFFIHAIPLALSKESFCSKVDKAEFISSQWEGDDNFMGLLGVMNNYRSTHGQKDYDTGSRVDYVKFISGLYTHEPDLQTDLNVDSTVQGKDPGLCYRLYAIMPNANTLGT